MDGGHTLVATNSFLGIHPLSMGIRIDITNIDKHLQGVKEVGYKLYLTGCGESDFVWKLTKI